ncbi:proto-oncogene Mas-like [Hemicordylus capensis]|uniref:proto-oncogene Mas-like n=1 Tax=Hemicordylus capensis TaxID=884348 RepID=UPI00230492FD|nr:proto-oncogene Mas-like [Hemicordylus capensis]
MSSHVICAGKRIVCKKDSSSPFIYFSICIICAFGLLANGVVIWLLGFCIKRNSFTTYILNLSVADFGVLIFLLNMVILILSELNDDVYLHFPSYIGYICTGLFLLMQSTGQLLLTAISIDRCVAVLFPLWHQCHRPPYCSTTVCTTLWVLSFLLCGVHIILVRAVGFKYFFLLHPFVINALLCLPLMIISSLILFIKVYLKSQQHKRGRVFGAILLSLLFFLIFSFPINALFIIDAIYATQLCLLEYGLMSASLNSSINPVIYFLLGRHKGSRCRESLKVILQRVFKEEEDPREEQEPSHQI